MNVVNVRLRFAHLTKPASEYMAAHCLLDSSTKRIALMTGDVVNTSAIARTACRSHRRDIAIRLHHPHGRQVCDREHVRFAPFAAVALRAARREPGCLVALGRKHVVQEVVPDLVHDREATSPHGHDPIRHPDPRLGSLTEDASRRTIELTESHFDPQVLCGLDRVDVRRAWRADIDQKFIAEPSSKGQPTHASVSALDEGHRVFERAPQVLIGHVVVVAAGEHQRGLPVAPLGQVRAPLTMLEGRFARSSQAIQIISWRRTVTLLALAKVEVVDEYETQIHAVSMTMQVPSIVRLRKSFPRRQKAVKFSRVNIYARDGYRCQYCGDKCTTDELTYDHVIPRTKGGLTNWENIVSACYLCNRDKANRTPNEAHMKLLSTPVRPTSMPAVADQREHSQHPGRVARLRVLDLRDRESGGRS